jgi:cyclic beta-1,2-glucan synthetase
VITEQSSATALGRAHAEVLTTTRRGSPVNLPARFPELLRTLRAARTALSVDGAKTPSSGSEWFLDNYYLIEQALGQVRQDLPAVYYRELPWLAREGDATRPPRTLALAEAVLAADELQLDPEQLFAFVDLYQLHSVLTQGDVWVLPTMLRVVLLQAIIGAASRLARLPAAKNAPPVTHASGGEDDDDIIATAVVSLRKLDRWDWKPAAERLSVVHRMLADGDPTGHYPAMDYDSRNRYRTVLEKAARTAGRSEVKVAEAALALAADSTIPRERHVGYFLIDAGLRRLETVVGGRPRLSERIRRALLARPTGTYLVPILVITTALVLAAAAYAGTGSAWAAAPAAILSLVPAFTAAVHFVNWALGRTLRPRVLPKLDFRDGIPDEHRTLVVVPGLVSRPSDVDSLLANIRAHYLRNPDPGLAFAAVTDFPDAKEATAQGDAEVLSHAELALAELNAATTGAPFLVLHRRRIWNETQKSWMGWERKRGKLQELDRLLRGATDTSFELVAGDRARLDGVRYVITLDADTVLPPDAAGRLAGTLAHPLNQATFDDRGRVVAGYTVLQPRAETDPMSTSRSAFTRAVAGDSTVDLYNMAVSDVYQDLFGEGNYMGKGIYDVDAFERSLEGLVPENALLSHDLFEGAQGRAGLVSDVTVYEDYPPNYLVAALRLSRWVRGDWQLLPWLGSRVPTERGHGPNTLPLVARWKMADNLRRSLVPASVVLLLASAWLWLPGSPWAWTLLALLGPVVGLAAGVVGALAAAASALVRGDRTRLWRTGLAPLRRQFSRAGLQLVGLAGDAVISLDAIVRTLWRMKVSRRNLLEWTTAAGAVGLVGKDVRLSTGVRAALPATMLTLTLGIAVVLLRPSALPAAAPFLAAWLAAPFIHYLVGRPERWVKPSLTAADDWKLRTLARRTWLFYEQFVGPEDNWLPPDNYQEAPLGIVAHRTSPTNVGLYFVAALAAHDRGYLGTQSFVSGLESAFDSLDRVEHYRGHPVNWVDTRSLGSLPPSYVSTVDSGNLAACLIVVAQGCDELPGSPVWPIAAWEGLRDAIALVSDGAAALGSGQQALVEYLAGLDRRVATVEADPTSWLDALPALLADVRANVSLLLADLVEHGRTLDPEAVAALRLHAGLLQRHLEALEREAGLALPWLSSRPDPVWEDALGRGPAAVAWHRVREALPLELTWADLPRASREAAAGARDLVAALADAPPPARDWAQALTASLDVAAEAADRTLDALQALAARARAMVADMDFGFLYDRGRGVFHIGFNLNSGLLDDSYYDLLASESRIASLIAIAKRDVPQDHWLHLGRPMTRTLAGDYSITSWSGTMFEYLMPTLLVPTPRESLLGHSCTAIVAHHIAYGRRRGVPWGISESGFYAFDAASGYQYRAFGVPGAGLTRGLADDLVVAPYASVLGLPYDPSAVVENLDRLEALGALGRYGMYEAVDFTASRVPLGHDFGIVRSHMAHHQGMIMLALAAHLDGPRMVRRFAREPFTAAISLLLAEQVPEGGSIRLPTPEPEDDGGSEGGAGDDAPAAVPTAPWTVGPPQGRTVAVHCLSNGRYTVLLTDSGAGHSTHDGVALTRWRADEALDDSGSWVYLQDLTSGTLWSAAARPCGPNPAETVFSPSRAEYRQGHAGIHSHLDITVAARDDVEIRMLDVRNESAESRRLAVTSFAEVALAPAADDLRHPAFSRLFVEAEDLPDLPGLLLRRRPRSADEPERFVVHFLVRGPEPEGAEWGRVRSTSDRARFLGRHRTPARPRALDHRTGWWRGVEEFPEAPLDPALALGQEVMLAAHGRVRLAVVTAVAPSREEALQLADRYRVWAHLEHAAGVASAHAQRELRELGFAGDDLAHTQRLLGLLLFPPSDLRVGAPEAAGPGEALGALWGLGISGDLPIVYLGIADDGDLTLLEQLLSAQSYWRRRGIEVDLAVVDEEPTGYAAEVRDSALALLGRLGADRWLGRRGGVFMLNHDHVGGHALGWLRHASRAVFDAGQGDLATRLGRLMGPAPAALPPFDPRPGDQTSSMLSAAAGPSVARPTGLSFDNGLGGFDADAREYQIYLPPGATTPAPWSNVIATPDVGCLATEAGMGAAWSVNSGENRLVAWRNDPLADQASQAVYVRDEETGAFWSTTPQPAGGERPTLVRHGLGYTAYEYSSHALRLTTTVFASPDPAAVVLRVHVTNVADRPRRITLTYFADLVLGGTHDATRHQVTARFDEATGAITARNPFHTDLADRVAWVATTHPLHGWTADRGAFIGRMGSLARPAGLSLIGLSRRDGPGVDPCAVLQVHLSLTPGGSDEVAFLLGQADSSEGAAEAVARLREPGAIDAAHTEVGRLWAGVLGGVTVETPDPAMDLLLNTWLPYQTLSARLWGRTGFYQSSGAYGFRDQLQDVMAVMWSRPDLAREHLLRAAAHQFEDGDVLHWWHPPTGRGVRTRISDDLLWLPYVTASYVRATGDVDVLRESVPFLHGEPLAAHEAERYDSFRASLHQGDLLEHCRRAVRRGITSGAHGLPLMGTGDWNDGMNRVGAEGRGESVWLGWFGGAASREFAYLCERARRADEAAFHRARAEELFAAVEAHGWDGRWYLRAFYDDGHPLGSAAGSEARIDSIAQSWALLSGAPRSDRTTIALASAVENLVRWEDRLAFLLTPPFEHTPDDPGYIKGYLPGIRENGGQYTHAAAWLAWAAAEAGDGDTAHRLFDLISPVRRTADADGVARYLAEPYVLAADVYSRAPHVGRAGWTWYTGSSAWLYRVGVEAILGMTWDGDSLGVAPQLPRDWDGYRATVRRGGRRIDVRVRRDGDGWQVEQDEHTDD